MKKEHAQDHEYVKRLWTLMKPYKWKIGLNQMYRLGQCVVGQIMPQIVAVMIDQILYLKNGSILIYCILAYLLLFLLYNFLEGLYLMSWQKIFNSFIAEQRVRVFRILLHANAEYLSTFQSGDAITYIENDLDQFMHVIHRNFINTIAGICRFLLALLFVFLIDQRLAFCMLLFVPASVGVSVFFDKKLKQIAAEKREQYGRFVNQLVDILNGIRDIRIYKAEKWSTNKMVQSVHSLYNKEVEAAGREFKYQKYIEFLYLLTTIGLYAVASALIIKERLTVGGFVAAVTYMDSMQLAMDEVIHQYTDLKKRMESLKRIVNVMSIPTEEQAEPETLPCKIEGNIEFRNVSFSYANGRQVLHNVTFNQII